MAGDTQITVIGNITADLELRTTSAGTPVAGFTVASTPRHFDRETNNFVDGETLFLRCSVWRDYAINASESLSKGDRVVVVGELKQRSYETDEGETRTVFEIDVEEVAPSLRFAQADVERVETKPKKKVKKTNRKRMNAPF